MRKVLLLIGAGLALRRLAPPGLPGTTNFDAALAGVAALLGWLIWAYLALCVALAALTRLPGLLGRSAQRASAILTPAAVRGLLGLTCSLGVVTAESAHAEQCPCPAISVDRPAEAPPISQPPARSKPNPAAKASAVVVRRGDTLWSIAAHRLGKHATAASIATHWPRWYAANRAVIGANPNLLFAGERLTPPDS